MELSEDDREMLVLRLQETLSEAKCAEVDAAWSPEIAHRIGEIDRGEVEMKPWEDDLAALRARFIR